MKFLIGVDEAGYGPNLGPLIVATTVWQLPEEVETDGLYRALKKFVVGPESRAQNRLVVGDSKLLYRNRQDLGRLESVVLGAAVQLGLTCARWRELWSSLAQRCMDELTREPWFAEFDAALPVEADSSEIVRCAARWRTAFEATGIQLLAIRIAAVFPEEWNRLLQESAGKGDVLSRTTLELVRDCCEKHLSTGALFVHCDKHGGRNRYGHLLQQVFPDYLVEIYRESRPLSLYRWGPPDRRIEFCFEAKGECCLGSALASMVAKYLRELAMQPFNRFWCERVPALRSTAGYPTDARRFWQETADLRRDLAIEDNLVWRLK
jgi:hypothetical protein